jgi:hypothetical protein
LGCQLNLHVLGAFFFVLLSGKIQMPKEFQHALVLAHHHRVEGPNSVGTRYVD